MQTDEHRSWLYPYLSVHEEYWIQRNNHLVYEYDQTDDGPEVDIISSILASHAWCDLYDEAYLRD